jgi:hypothetical protein
VSFFLIFFFSVVWFIYLQFIVGFVFVIWVSRLLYWKICSCSEG